MKTTLNLDDELLRRAKRRAALEGGTLTGVVEEALRTHLIPAPARGRAFKLRILSKRGRVMPGVDFSDRDSLYDRMEGGR